MSADLIQANYEQLDQVAARFAKQADAATELHQRLSRAVAPLEDGGWRGSGADAFFTEMRGTVFPAVGRLSAALGQAQNVVRQIVQLMREAEAEAARPFQSGESDAGAQSGAATAAGAGASHGAGSPSNNADLGAKPTDMASLVDLLNRQDQHITIVDLGNNEYMVLLKGMDITTVSGTNSLVSAFQSGLGLSGAYEDQVRDAINAAVPPGGKINFVGHSLGGIVAHNLVNNQDFMDRYKVESVTTFGSPQSAPMLDGIEYNRFRNSTDPVPYLDGGVLMQRDTAAQISEFASQTPVDSHNLLFAAHDMKNYELAPELQGRALPAHLDLSNWQSARPIAEVKAEFQQNALSNNPVFALVDRVDDLRRTVPLAIANRAVNSVSTFLPAGLRKEVDRWTDRTNDFVLNDIPSPSEVVGGVIDRTSAVGHWFMDRF